MLGFWKKSPPQPVPSHLPELSLNGARVSLRPPQMENFRSWQKVRAANIAFLKPYEPTWPQDCLNVDFFKRRLKRQVRNWYNDEGCAFLIFDEYNALIGGMNINNISRGVAQFCSLGYWLAEDKQGQGYMSEALQLTLKYCFEDLKLHRVNASCLLNNQRSKALLLRAGFDEEGMAKKYIKIDGRWQDHNLFGLNIEDWAARL